MFCTHANITKLFPPPFSSSSTFSVTHSTVSLFSLAAKASRHLIFLPPLHRLPSSHPCNCYFLIMREKYGNFEVSCYESIYIRSMAKAKHTKSHSPQVSASTFPFSNPARISTYHITALNNFLNSLEYFAYARL